MADIGWITGHSYIVYGPLSLAATSVMYEGVPNYPDTLANPAVVGHIREMVQGKQPPGRGQAPEDIRRFGTEG